MSRPQWITKAGTLGTLPELVYFDYTLEVSDPAGDGITYSFLSGQLPPGIQVLPEGKVQGVPVVLEPISIDESRTYNFTIRATDSNLVVVDRTFSLTVSNVFPPIIVPRISYIGSYLDGSYFEKQLTAVEENPAAVLSWQVTNGVLPPGMSLSSSGLLSGYIRREPLSLEDGIKGYDSAGLIDNQVYKQSYDNYPYDYPGRSRHKDYTFDVRVGDGANYDTMRYTIGIIAKGLLTVDQGSIVHPDYPTENISLTIDNSYVTVDADNRYVPIITTPSQSLPTIRQDNNFAFKFDAIDFEDYPVSWSIRPSGGGTFDENGRSSYKETLTETNSVTGQAEATIYEYGITSNTNIQFASNTISSTFLINTTNYIDSAVFTVSNVFLTSPTVIVGTTTYSNVTTFVEGVDYELSEGNTLVSFNSPPGVGTISLVTSIQWPGEAPPSTEQGATVNLLGFDGDNTLFDESESRLPPDLQMDDSGWLYGSIIEQPEAEKTYNFIVTAYKTVTIDGETFEYPSRPVNYSLTVLGDSTDQITWITPNDLGYIVNGAVSELKIEAVSALNQDIIYSLQQDASKKLPQGLSLLSNGLISGRSTFRHFTLDGGETTFDKDSTFFDNLYTFNVKAETVIHTGTTFPSVTYAGKYAIRIDYSPYALFKFDGISWERMTNVSITASLQFPDTPNQSDYVIQLIDNKFRLFQYTGTSWIPITSSTTKTFTIRMNNRYKVPYENLYLKAFPSVDQREIFNRIIGNSEIFPDTLIYRPNDPWFGKATDIKFLEMSGIAPSSLEDYVSSIENNHYWKKINFGDVKTAIATDEYYNTKYEVVYIEVVDPLNPGEQNVVEHVTIQNNPYLEYNLATPTNLTDTVSYLEVYPNSFENMNEQVVSALNYSARGILPDWMTSVQPDKTVIGFKRAVILAYTVPGASKLIAYRLKNNNITFNAIDFTVDRYQLDNQLSSNFDIDTDAFISSKETTFDRLILGPGLVDGGVVNYSSVKSFDSINKHTVDYINARGGIDGVKTFRDGDTMIFAKQEKYINNPEMYDGWVNYQYTFGDDFDPSEIVEALDNQTGFDSYTVVPGYYERLQTITQLFLAKKAELSDTFIVVPYTVGVDYTGKSVSSYSGISDNTYVTSQLTITETVGGVDRYYIRLNINNPVTLEQFAGTPITLNSSVLSAAGGAGYKIILDNIPEDFKVGMILHGSSIPDNTIVTAINGTEITTNQILNNVPADVLISYFVPNQRAGIWRINIDSMNVVTLEFIQEIEVGQKVKVLEGSSFGFTFLTYDPLIKDGFTVPAYSLWSDIVKSESNTTIFDKSGTRFFDYRDSYTAPGTGDKYIKFPQIGVFT
jgi:hypothetical protein